MIEKILPEEIYAVLRNKLDFNRIYEVRMRVGSPIVLDYGGKNFFLSGDGLTLTENQGIICDERLINSVVFKASNNSVYASTEQIKQGFITSEGGIRIGICGEAVLNEKNEITTIKNFSSINIRIPHEVKDCSLNALRFLVGNSEVKNTLIISPPGGGKTTFLRDIARLVSQVLPNKNLLVVDERYEIAAVNTGRCGLNVGKFTDVITGTSKEFGFKNAIRTMRPDILLCDELASRLDCEAVIDSVNSGVKVIATVHAKTLQELKNKKVFERFFNERIFERYIVLSRTNGPGTIDGIFDDNYSCLFCR